MGRLLKNLPQLSENELKSLLHGMHWVDFNLESLDDPLDKKPQQTFTPLQAPFMIQVTL